MPVDREDIDPIVESTGDKAHRVVRASIGALPVFSGTAVELFNSLIIPPLEKRKTKWMIDVTESIQNLEKQKLINVSELFQNEEFISFLLNASSAAIKIHQKEKLNALKNAVINMAINQSPEEEIALVFLNLVERFSIKHLKILNVLHQPKVWAKNNRLTFTNAALADCHALVNKAFPKDNVQINSFIINDLQVNNLVEISMFDGDPLEKHTTDIGDSFISFINNNT